MSEPAITLLASGFGGFQDTVNRIVLHDEEYSVGPNSAEQIAQYFHNAGTQASAHYVVDADSVQHCVPENRVAWHAPPNTGSIGIEHDGYAHFDASQWAQPGSQATLKRSAALCADICARHDIPVVFLTVGDLLAGKRGITTHANVSAAFHQSDHRDPGPHFPIDQYLGWVRDASAPKPAPAPSPKPTPAPAPSPAVKVPAFPLAAGNWYGEPSNDPHNHSGYYSTSDAAGIREFQQRLKDRGWSVSVDGKFGKQTGDIVAQFQREKGLTADRKVGPVTWSTLWTAHVT